MFKFLIITLMATTTITSIANANTNTGRSSKSFRTVEPWLGQYYRSGKTISDANCPTSFEIYVKRDQSHDKLVGIKDAFDVGFDIEVEKINANPIVSDAGRTGDRTTSFNVSRSEFAVVDSFSNFDCKVTMNKRIEDSDGLLQQEIVTLKASGFIKGGHKSFSCEYTHFSYSK